MKTYEQTNNKQVYARLGPAASFTAPKPTNNAQLHPVPRLTGYESA